MSNRRQDNPNRRDVGVYVPPAEIRGMPISITNSHLGNLNRLFKAARLERARHRPPVPSTRAGHLNAARVAKDKARVASFMAKLTEWWAQLMKARANRAATKEG